MSKAVKSVKKGVKKVFKNKWVRLAAIAVATYFTAGAAGAYFGGLAASGAISSSAATVATGATTGAVAGGLSEGSVEGAVKGAAVGGALSGVSVAAKGVMTKTAAQTGVQGSTQMSAVTQQGVDGGINQAVNQMVGPTSAGAQMSPVAQATTSELGNVAVQQVAQTKQQTGRKKFLDSLLGDDAGEKTKKAWGSMDTGTKLMLGQTAFKALAAYTQKPPPTPYQMGDFFSTEWRGEIQQPDFLQRSPQQTVGQMPHAGTFLPGGG